MKTAEYDPSQDTRPASERGADYRVIEPTFEVDYGVATIPDRPNNPLVPIGCAVTAGVLGVGLWSFMRGNTALSQKMMRGRLIAQGLTVAAMAASMPGMWGGRRRGA